jgi:hypothetical protein
MDATIGTGLIGNIITNKFNVQHTYNRKNIDQFVNYKYNTVYCAAPSSDRIFANQNPAADFNSTQKLIDIIRHENWNQMILISTVDSLVKDTPYGLNRKLIANELKKCKNFVSVLILPSLIHKDITKNILYDLKNKNEYIKYINLSSAMQWYDLENLHNDIEFAIENKLKNINLVSEPVTNKEIVNCFYSENFDFEECPVSAFNYDIRPYRYTKQQILDSMNRYFANGT